jgi:hypothetical protein
MRVNVLLEHVARHLRIDATIVGCVVWQPVSDGKAER